MEQKGRMIGLGLAIVTRIVLPFTITLIRQSEDITEDEGAAHTVCRNLSVTWTAGMERKI